MNRLHDVQNPDKQKRHEFPFVAVNVVKQSVDVEEPTTNHVVQDAVNNGSVPVNHGYPVVKISGTPPANRADTLVAELHAFVRKHAVMADGSSRPSALKRDRHAFAVWHVRMYMRAPAKCLHFV